jgi:hypothetical protein
MMNTHTIARLAMLASAALYAMPGHATVEAGHWSLSNAPQVLDSNVGIYLDQTVGGDYTGSFISYEAATGALRFVTLNVDEGSELFLAQAGSSFSNATAQTPAFTSLFSASTTPIQAGTDFYLAGRTRSMSDPGFSWNQPDFYDSFGWAHLKVDPQGKLQILGSAMAFREAGIVVGTTQAVPEPGTYALMAIGLLGMATLRLRKTRKA